MAKKITSAQDSIPKQTYFSKNSKGIVSGKSGGDYFIEKMGRKPKPDTLNLAKALRAPKALAAQKIAAQKRPMGLKTDSASNMVKALTSPKAKIAQAVMGNKRGMGLKVDSTKKVTPIGGSKPSVIIKKQTTVKPANPVKLLKNK